MLLLQTLQTCTGCQGQSCEIHEQVNQTEPYNEHAMATNLVLFTSWEQDRCGKKGLSKAILTQSVALKSVPFRFVGDT